jgi:hypothetical protein
MNDGIWIKMPDGTATNIAGVPLQKGDMLVMGGDCLAPCCTCRHWNQTEPGSVVGLCTSDTPHDKARGFLYAAADARRPCWEATP